ncbi:Sirohydrochlorin cobaltochelatase [Poriferisphaera corsica]|uniref:Sirohydrochlorin cobaltochelatase n=1 Tax=Poriferisphaera corsica TaxID=2528020 RepID=A0A517YPD5_9BACT|nr:CbiX/SirB N-terminal domain-containing protein [Poriferisphaera corsica]QDU32094.1 Sirohydrochlorin cobaltochelatase [Poriferisphaera corsica]
MSINGMRKQMKYMLPMVVIVGALVMTAVLPLVVSGAVGDKQADVKQVVKDDVAVVLVGHGVPPSDFPRNELRAAIKALNEMTGHDHGDGGEDHEHDAEGEVLAKKLLNWPMTRENNAYYFGVKDIADVLRSRSGLPVFIGFNEFCGPTTGDAIDTAVKQGYTHVIVTTVMMTPGGGHSERDILNSMKRVEENYPHVKLTYAWPFPVERVAGVLHEQVMDSMN